MGGEKRKYVVIVASNYRQAMIVAEQLDLPAPNSGQQAGRSEYVIFVGPDDRAKLLGLLPDRVIWASPILCDRADRERLRAVRDLAESRLARNHTRQSAEVVRT